MPLGQININKPRWCGQTSKVKEMQRQHTSLLVNGRLVSDPSWRSSLRFHIVWKRVFLVLLSTLLLTWTNPVNQDGVSKLLKRTNGTERFRKNKFILGREKRFFDRRITNYGLFALEESFDGMILHGLLQSWTCSFNDNAIGEICDRLGEYKLGALLVIVQA